MATTMTDARQRVSERVAKLRRTWLFTLLKVALSVIALGFVLRFLNFEDAAHHLRNQSPIYLAIAAAIFSLQVVLGGLRWHAILIALETAPTALESIRLFYISAFFNSYLWGGIGGDALRSWLTYRRGASIKAAINSVVLDRATAVAAVAILILVSSPLYISLVGARCRCPCHCASPPSVSWA